MPLVFLVEKPGKNACFAEILGFRLNCRYIIYSSKHEKEELCLLSGHGMRINVTETIVWSLQQRVFESFVEPSLHRDTLETIFVGSPARRSFQDILNFGCVEAVKYTQ